MMGLLAIALVAGYVAFQVWLWIRDCTRVAVPFAVPAAAATEIASGAHIYDVRSHGYFDVKAIRIQGSRRLNPNALHRSDEAFPTGQVAYLYCTCVREATSVRVARELQKKGVRVAVIRGGLRGWTKAGLPVEAVPAEEIAALPVFG